MGRRQVVEPVNSAFKGAFVDLSRGFFRVFGQSTDTANSSTESCPTRRQRVKRRTGVWAELVDPRSQPPPG